MESKKYDNTNTNNNIEYDSFPSSYIWSDFTYPLQIMPKKIHKTTIPQENMKTVFEWECEKRL